ncbi:MAG: DUF814 domain-containing protein [Candidatus Eremiobacteraeota bacterium]|nr:DUF814 domain-containing protein [Candidatus Eremiobacteraeota bacterium]MBC5802246.1 DUF814 domain-containing protein [Candidatus Eremiobacteraeota bacterium]MBC5820564.1 DUF814 domain-containing protein [Candidatus Eremiobacteraeota bacterium]
MAGLRIESVRARRGDRLIAFECSARSRFGVRSAYRLVAELVPRFGNIVLLKDDTIVAAAKEFTHAENARRATVVGERYEPPPLAKPAAANPGLTDALRALLRAPSAATGEHVRRALRAQSPLVPPLIADSVIADAIGLERTAAFAGRGPDESSVLAQQCLSRARDIVDEVAEGRYDNTDVFAYRDGTQIVQCHIVPLAQYAGLAQSRAPALLPLLHDALDGITGQRTQRAFQRRRDSLAARLAKRRTALAAERRALERDRDDASQRDTLRRAGEALYAHLADVPAGATTFVPPSDPDAVIALDPELDAKTNAAAIFKRYRKAVAKLAHVESRLAEVSQRENDVEHIAWELERAEPETLDDVVLAAESLERHKRHKSASQGAPRAGRPLGVRLADDARVYVGRSPRSNADVTFRIARPHDLWFHARATPGAHVVLHIDSQRTPTSDELDRAAALAAFHSKARASEKVSVDYTERRFVRRQQNAPPGLVWYTNARTLLVKPENVVV